jgi:hypothetical protein
LFPRGLGGPESSDREISVPLEQSVQKYLKLDSCAFRQHHHFMYNCFNPIQRRKTVANSTFVSKRMTDADKKKLKV